VAVKSQRYYSERAAYMRELARKAELEVLKISCIKAAESYELLAKRSDQEKPDPKRNLNIQD
jgi:hypothetical protein